MSVGLISTPAYADCRGLGCLNPLPLLGGGIKTITDAAGNVISTATDAAGTITQTIKRIGGEIETTVTTAAGQVTTTIQKVGGDVLTTIKVPGGDITETLKKASGDFEQTITKASGDILKTVQTTGGDFTSTLQKANGDVETTLKKASGDVLKTVQIAGGDFTSTLQKANGDVETTLKKASGDVLKTVQIAGGDFTSTLQKANGDVETTIRNATGDVITTVQIAGGDLTQTINTTAGDVLKSVQKAAGDTVTTIHKAGSDTITTIEKGWKDTSAETQRAYKNTVDAGSALERYEVRELQGTGYVLSHTLKRIQQGKVVDALWGLGTEPLQNSNNDAASLAQESSVLRAAAQIAAGAYGGPAGAAAFAAWYTYNETGNAELALRAGVLTGATSYAFSQVNGMPSGTAGDIAKKAVVGGAIGGLSVAAAGGDKDAVKHAFLMSAGAILVQTGYQASTNRPLNDEALRIPTKPGLCMLTVGADCSPPASAYFRDPDGNILDEQDEPLNDHGEKLDENGDVERDAVTGKPVLGIPKVDVTKTDLNDAGTDNSPTIDHNHVGVWTTAGDHGIAGEQSAFMQTVAKVPGMNAMALFHDQWTDSWQMGTATTVSTIIPAVVLTYIGTGSPVYEQIRTTFIDDAKNKNPPKLIPNVMALGSADMPDPAPVASIPAAAVESGLPTTHSSPGASSAATVSSSAFLRGLINHGYYICKANVLTRTILAVSPQDQGCRVIYQSERGLSTPWRAQHDPNYCTSSAKQLVSNLLELGWKCQLQ